MSLLQNSNAIQVGGYAVQNSLRFQSASTTYGTRTPASNGNLRKWTYSAWVKRGLISNASQYPTLISATLNASFNDSIYFNVSTDTIDWNVSNTLTALRTTQVFRDPGAWYHIVLVWDTDNATAANRARIYINGSEVTAFSIDNRASISARDSTFNRGSVVNYLGGSSNSVLNFDGYMAEVNFIDGQALTPSSFGETDTLTGQWVAKKYTGTYGTNGFYLPFSNGTSTTTLGYDSSGNSNNWTLNNFTRSAGVSDCWMYDVPSGNGSNYPTLNPLSYTNATITNSNLTASLSGAAGFPSNVRATFAINSGKWYWENIVGSGGLPAAILFGIADVTTRQGTNLEGAINQVMYSGTGNKLVNGVASAYGATYTSGDVIGVALDFTASTITFYKNNVSQGAISLPSTTIEYNPIYFHDSASNSSSASFNFGQRLFAYTPPSGYKALCTANLPAATIKKGNTVFDATLYTGTGVAKSVTNAAGFSPDFVWLKNRSHNDADPYYGVHLLYNTIAGAGNRLMSQSTAAEAYSSQSLTSFNSNGFSIGTDASVNYNGDAFVAWQWDAGSSTVTNANGTISSQVRANPTAGVSVVTWTPTASAGTVGHGLGVAPKMIVMKDRQNSYQWFVYHASIGAGKYLGLNTTTATTTNASVFSTTPTSSVFDPGTGLTTGNLYGTQVAFCFAEIAGFSKFGSYTGNGSTDGPFVYTGFRPKFVMWKSTGTAQNWSIEDSSRSTYNAAVLELFPNASNAEENNGSAIDFLSNGIKFRNTNANMNANGGTYIYMAFAESPFSSSNSR